MTAVIPYLLAFTIAAAAVVLMRRVYLDTIDRLIADNNSLRDRLFIKHQMPPAAVNLGQRAVERDESMRVTSRSEPNGKRKTLGPLERWTQEMTYKDLKEADASRR